MRNINKKLIKINLFLFTLFIILIILFSRETNAYESNTNYSFSYDANGNMINDVSHTYEYNDFNQLVKIRGGGSTGRVTSEFFYDYDGTRLMKIEFNIDGSNTTTYYYEDYIKIVNSSSINEIVYYYLSDLLLAEENNDQTFYHHPDHLGSVSLITDLNGQKVSQAEYLPYGEEISSSESIYGFTGKEKEDNSLMYYGARYYSPTLTRFIQPDEIISDIYNPQLLNRYSYTLNNPIKYTDPSGNIIDTIADIGFLAWDIYDVIKNPESNTNWASLGADAACMFIPFATGGGRAIKLAKEASKLADGEKIVDGIKVADEIKNGIKTVDKAKDYREIAEKAIKNKKGLDHGYNKHSAELGLGFTGKSKSTEFERWINLNKEIISNPQQTFSKQLGKEMATGYYKQIDGQDIVVFVYETGPNKGGIASTWKFRDYQMAKYMGGLK